MIKTFLQLNYRRATQSVVASMVISGLFIACLPSISLAKSKKWPQQSFLPPVASINGMLSPEDYIEPHNDVIEPIALAGVTTPTIHTTPPVTKLDTGLDISKTTEAFKLLIKKQKELDETDLKTLWDATVEKNPVIRFSLEKLATPPDLHDTKSSLFLKKTLNLLISGATLGAAAIPGGGIGGYRTMGAVAGGDALRNMVNGGSTQKGAILTPTEQIQLAGLIDELQGKLIQSYHDYKNALVALETAHRDTLKNHNLYSKALSTGNDVAAMAAGTAYYKAQIEEMTLRQKAKMMRLSLERLAGKTAVEEMNLAVAYDPKEAEKMEAALNKEAGE